MTHIAKHGLILGFAVMLPAMLSAAEGDPARGAQVYGACVACHALKPGLHLTGPSLGAFLDRPAGTAKGYVRYSANLERAGFAWDATLLDAWLGDPAAMIPGTFMTFSGIDDPAMRSDLIAFLEIVGRADGAARLVDDGWIPPEWVRAQAPASVRHALPEARVSSIKHCGDSFFIKTESGADMAMWEKNVRLKIDSVETGPPPGIPVIQGSGMQGDRFSVIFASLADLKAQIEENC